MIGYYVHHQGRGHLARLQAVATHLRSPVTGLSTLPAPSGWEDRWLRLPADDEPAPGPADDIDAHGLLHWAPLRHNGVGERAAAITAWVASARPRLVVTDVSVEAAVLGRLCGVPVVPVVLPGDRTDRAHTLAHDLAAGLLAPWPEGTHDTAWPERWRAKARFVGGLSRFDASPRPVAAPATARPRVLVVWGGGGRDVLAEDVAAARAATPGWDWVERSPAHPSPDLWHELCTATVVVTHAGQNAVADVAAARAPAVVVAQHRPFGEQEATARAVRRLGVAEGVTRWPAPQEWPALLERSVRRGGHGWARWSTGRGAADAAAWLDALARDLSPSPAASAAR
ncbi:glycosyltransferase [Phycicoccus avicenniae]|uniref:glycosyltransferase n=1 Tax=Phycicoccus avicenniae TaxID=2828860 RepID=UPI003D2A9ADF